MAKSSSIVNKLLRYAEFLGFGEIHIKVDPATNLQAIIAVHSTQRGPAIGGCRCISYESAEDAIQDALRLSQMMSYKAAACGLPHGGAKSVLIKPKQIKDRQAYFQSFGNFVNELNGRYVAAVDSGTSPADMDAIATRTSYVTCTTAQGGGDPSPYTALGVMRGIKAAVKFKLGQDDLKNVRVAVQGAGNVGYYLTKYLIEEGALVSQCDINPENLKKVVEQFHVQPVSTEEIFDIDCDIFAPCALGAVLNADTIKRLKAGIVAGSANNQLAHRQYGHLLHEKNILYAPDFVINAGGLIHVAAIYDHGDEEKAHQQIFHLYDTMLTIFERAQNENKPTAEIADIIALENMGKTIKQPQFETN